jgi:hypothetical protein
VYDEALLSYREAPAAMARVRALPEGAYGRKIVAGGHVVGTWDATVRQGQVMVTARPVRPLGRREAAAVEHAAGRYARFLDAPLGFRVS